MPRTPLAPLLLALGTAFAAPVPKAVKKADPFPHALGTRWEYVHDGDATKVWVEEVVEVTEKDGAVTFKVDITPDVGPKRSETYRLKGGELVLTATGNGEFDPPMLIAKAGMKAGDEWDTKYAFVAPNGRAGQAVEVTLTVGKAEEVATPAGTFTALPIARTTKGPVGNSTTTFYFAEGVGMIRQASPGQKEPLQDLKAFTPGKGKK